MLDKKNAELLFTAAEELDLQPHWLTDYGLFSITNEGEEKYIFYSTTYLNSELSAYLAKNKHSTRVILAEHNLPNISFCLPASFEEAKEFLNLHKRIIAKPTLGMHSTNIHLIQNEHQLIQVDLTKSLLEKFIEGEEFRVLVLHNEVIAFHRKLYTPPINDPDNVRRIAFEKKDWDGEMTEIALKSVQVLGLAFGCVDFLRDKKGSCFVLEINTAPGIYHFEQPDEGPGIPLAEILLREIMK